MKQSPNGAIPNGAALAAVLAAGIGAAALGLVMLLHEAEILTVRAIYAPVGGLSGRTTAVAIVWLVAWAILNVRWRERELSPAKVLKWTLGLTAFGLLATFPPLWALL